MPGVDKLFDVESFMGEKKKKGKGKNKKDKVISTPYGDFAIWVHEEIKT